MPNAKHEYYLRRVSVGVEGGGANYRETQRV